MDPRSRRLITLGVLALLVLAVVVGAWRNGANAASGPGAAETAPTADEKALAERFAPYVVVRVQAEECSEGEPYRPVAVDTVLGDDQVVLRGPDDEIVVRAPTAADLAGRGDGYYLDFPGDPLDPGCDYEEWFRGKGEVPDTVYARVATDPAHPDQLVLQYWLWWVYNDWNDKHEGDWEMIQLVFDASSAEEALQGEPSEVAFAQHEGSEVAAWDAAKLLRDGDHVAVYPGQGSHAAYFTQSRWFGKSAAAGFGCDNTGLADGLDAEVLQPRVTMITDDTEWLTYSGRWGEKAPSFNNGPTGPNTKTQWTAPVTWQIDEGRESAVALPVVLSSAEEGFCALTEVGSMLFIGLLDAPAVVALLLLVLVGLVVALLRSTRWRGSPEELDTERTAGQILAGPIRVLRDHGGLYSGVILALMGLLLLSYWIQVILLRPEPTTDLARVGAPAGSFTDLVLSGVGTVVAALLTALAGAYTMAVTRGIPHDPPAGLAVQRPTRRGMWRTVLSYIAVVACLATILLIPVAVYLVGRWAVATPAAVAEDLPVGTAGQRSADLIRGSWPRSFAIMIGCLACAAVPGTLVGGILLLITPLSFSVVNVIVIVVTSVAVVYSAIAMTLHFFDRRCRLPVAPTDEPQEIAA